MAMLNQFSMKHSSPFSRLVGSALAHIQSLTDDVFHYGFRKLRQLGRDSEERSEVVSWAKGAVRFLGDSGESYYETYERIKAKKAQRAEKRQKSQE